MCPAWERLLFLHWPVDAESVRALLPPGVEVDTFEGRAWVGLVPFTMKRVRPRWAPAPGRAWYENFHETNVRTYVVCNSEPGVWFFSLDAASALAVVAARAWYKLPYFHARMTLQENGANLFYKSRRLWPRPLRASCAVAATPQGEIFHAAPETFEHFLVERYTLFSHARNRLFRGQVHHAPYPLQRAEITSCEESLVAAAGIVRPDCAPHALYSAGVDVEIFDIEPVSKN